MDPPNNIKPTKSRKSNKSFAPAPPFRSNGHTKSPHKLPKSKKSSHDSDSLKTTDLSTENHIIPSIPAKTDNLDLDSYIDLNLIKALKTTEKDQAFRFHYTDEQRRQIFELFKLYDVPTVYKKCKERISIGTLRWWKKRFDEGGDSFRKKGSGRRAAFTDLEKKLYEWVILQRKKQLPITCNILLEKAKLPYFSFRLVVLWYYKEGHVL